MPILYYGTGAFIWKNNIDKDWYEKMFDIPITTSQQNLSAGSDSNVLYVDKHCRELNNQDDFLTEQSSSLRPYHIPQIYWSIKINFLDYILLLFMGIGTKFSVRQATATTESH